MTERPKVCAVLSHPRFAPVDSIFSICETVCRCGLPMIRWDGALWGQGMQTLLERAITGGWEWAVAFDFDTLARPDDLRALLRRMQGAPEIDALAALQVKRYRDEALFCTDSGLVDTDGAPFEVLWAHFGMTIIRLSALSFVERPWFRSEPNAAGGWDGGVDDDIWFWRAWRKAGFKTYVDPLVRIGHLETTAAFVDSDGQARRAPVGDWLKGTY